jgi:glutathione S-transferase
MTTPSVPTVYFIPACPFSQRLEILLALKGASDAVAFHRIDITQPRPAWLLAKTRGATALPVLETSDGGILRESLVIMDYLEDSLPARPVRQRDPWRRAVENMLVAKERDFAAAGYRFVLNQDRAKRATLRDEMLAQYAGLDAFLTDHSPARTFLFEELGWAEAVFTSLFMRFWFLEYYEDFQLPDSDAFARVRRWRDACLAHPATQQVEREEIVKLYYDYSLGFGNGALPPGRTCSSFAFEPAWRARPWPPADKYDRAATDAELGLLR